MDQASAGSPTSRQAKRLDFAWLAGREEGGRLHSLATELNDHCGHNSACSHVHCGDVDMILLIYAKCDTQLKRDGHDDD